MLSVVGPICLYQYLLAPNLTVFLIRLVTQTRTFPPVQINISVPER